jgi:hypothetical protein
MPAAAEWQTVPPPRGSIFHIGRRTDPFIWRVPSPLDFANPGGSRFDDPNGRYATLYCATRRYGALLEKLSPLRPIPELAAQYDSALDDDADPAYDQPAPGTVFPVDFTTSSVMGIVTIDSACCFLDVDDPHNHRRLEQLGGRPLLDLLEISRIDRGTFVTLDRRLTRQIAGELHDILSDDIAGLRYTSAIDQAAECWAIWDHARDALSSHDIEPFDLMSPDMEAVVKLLGFKTSP